ncbi:MAG: hypothetical protein ACOY94_21740 [Bacillota bacterium]
MIGALSIGLLQWVAAFFALDLTFRMLEPDPERLRGQVRLWRGRFWLLALVASLGGGAVQVWAAGWWGLALALLGPLPWWVLWRFGWRKQFTFLYRHDGGRTWARKENEPDL